MDVDQLNALLEQLRRFRADHQYVEAKRAQTGLPRRLWRTLSAFANTGGGLVLLGVDEEADFAVTGVENPGQLQSDLEDLAAEMRPSMHPIIDQVDHPQGVVIAAHIEAIPRGQRPCCHPRKGARGGSYVRVGDGDHALSDVEVNELQATKQQNDLTLRPAPQGAVISTESAVRFCKLIRQTKDRFRDSEDAEILRVWSVRSEDGELTLAGLLALGEHPQRFTSAARLRYRVQPSSSAPEGARSSGTHLEGTVGAILDQTMTQLRDDLEVYQVAESSGLMEDTDVPSEALREVVSNALIHRSFTPDLEEEPVTVEVSSSAVRVVSPGALPVRVDPEKMGVHRFSGPRNLSLARICEELTTPSGHSIVESQGYGIRVADRVCRTRGVAPPLFVDHHGQLEVLFLRGGLPTEEAGDLLDEAGAKTGPCRRRLVAWAIRYERLLGELDPERIRAAELDEYLAARLCTPTPKEDVVSTLTGLESDGVLQRAGGFPRTRWQLGPAASLPADVRASMLSGDRVRDVLDAIVAAGGEASRESIGDHMGLTSTRSTMKWINKAREKGLLEGTTESEFDPRRTYVLTETGSAVQKHQRNRS